MKLQFDANLTYQQEAIASVINLFAGQESFGAGLIEDFTRKDATLWSELGVCNGNLPAVDELLKNLHKVQMRNQIPKSLSLIGTAGNYAFPNFSGNYSSSQMN